MRPPTREPVCICFLVLVGGGALLSSGSQVADDRRLGSRAAGGHGLHAEAEAEAADEDEHELHAENQAEHVTPLFRREKPRPVGAVVAQDGLIQFKEVGEHRAAANSAAVNLTTQLEDMTSEYIGHIGVGTNAEGTAQFKARVVFDTGSTNLWVASVLCTDFPCTSDKAANFYDPKKSVTQEEYSRPDGSNPGKDLDIIFGTGELKGPLHVDTYRVGPMVVKKQPFGMIRYMSGSVFSSFPFEGILGLGFRSLSFGGIEPFFERVIDQKLLKSNEFSFFLNADSSQPSAILWGGIDKSLYNGPIRMFPVVQEHYWALELADFRIGNTSVGRGHANRVIIDSGTTYFTAPTSLYSKVTKRLAPATCSEVERNSDRYSPLVFVLKGASGKTFELKVSQETYMLGDGTQGDNAPNNVGNCRPAFMRLDVAKKYGPAMILGEVFMRSFFTVFSRGTEQGRASKVGFAKARVGAVPKGSGGPSFLQPAEAAAAADALAERKEITAPRATPRRRLNPSASASASAGSRLVRRAAG